MVKHSTHVAVEVEQQRVATYLDRLATIRRRLAKATPRASVVKLIRSDRD